MANKLYEESNIQAIANAIRAKGQTGTMTVAQMAGKIAAIETDPVLVNKTVTSNGTYNASDDSADGYDKVIVNVSAPTPTLQNKTVTPSTSQQSVTADTGYDGLDTVTVNAMPSGTAGTPTASKSVSNHVATVTPQVTNSAGYISSGTKTGTAVTVNPADLGAVVPGGTKNITENGTYDVTNYASANVNVPTGGGGTYTVKLKNNGHVSYAYVRYGSTVYYTEGDEITVNAGEKIYIKAYAGSSNTIYINGNGIPGGSTELAYTVSNDVAVSFNVALGSGATVRLATNGYVYKQDKTVTSNGTVTADTGYDGLGTVTVNVSGGGGETVSGTAQLYLFNTCTAVLYNPTTLEFTDLDFDTVLNLQIPKNSVIFLRTNSDNYVSFQYYLELSGCEKTFFHDRYQYGSDDERNGSIAIYNFTNGFSIYYAD